MPSRCWRLRGAVVQRQERLWRQRWRVVVGGLLARLCARRALLSNAPLMSAAPVTHPPLPQIEHRTGCVPSGHIVGAPVCEFMQREQATPHREASALQNEPPHARALFSLSRRCARTHTCARVCLTQSPPGFPSSCALDLSSSMHPSHMARIACHRCPCFQEHHRGAGRGGAKK